MKKRQTNKNPNIVATKILLIGLTLLLGWAFIKGLDKSNSNHYKMLCESALISGNEEYTKKCECYYKGESINCL